MDMIPQKILSEPISGVNISGNTLRQEIGESETLLVFLRHFGCLFCREMVRDVRAEHYKPGGFLPTLFFYQGSVEDGVRFFDYYWPDARAIADPEMKFYHAFGIDRAGFGQLVGPEVVACGIRATLKGNMAGKPIGDVKTMPGMFIVKGSSVLWQHNFRHAGDHPDLTQIPRMMPA